MRKLEGRSGRASFLVVSAPGQGLVGALVLSRSDWPMTEPVSVLIFGEATLSNITSMELTVVTCSLVSLHRQLPTTVYEIIIFTIIYFKSHDRASRRWPFR